ncbi:DUF2269 domain-containing protein [Streptomyces boncukensis]|uniref:DUF2269 domain-containing protein n=1 Tax=Streptomyces boncukensis TaxID=2711219 RepID=A0A6G4X9I7_9ACTN|nr:DUF2269 domain-containing protein [Streptomyces boncukensis]NGO73414.1 DUF2269 domain-containing protein [Streptomyces boncukensis]
MQRLSRPARRALLVVHVTSSACWLGLSLCLLALGLTGAATGAGSDAGAGAYRSMKVFGDWLLTPVALLTLLTGLLLSLGTPWGLARYRWVYTKFWLTLATTAASVLAFRATINEAASAVGAGDEVGAVDLVIPPSVSLAAYAFMTAISVLKPWGPTRRGRAARRRDRGRADQSAAPTGRRTSAGA